MLFFPVFLSVVYVVRNQSQQLENIIKKSSTQLASLVQDYELIIVENASSDDSVSVLKEMTSQAGYPNLQVYALTKEVDSDTASWVGLENALGDFVAVIDPCLDDINFVSHMIDKAINCDVDVVFAQNQQKTRQSCSYRVADTIFNSLYKLFNGIHLTKDAPQYRLLSKKVVNFILQHSQPALTYRYLPASGGFARSNMQYSSQPINKKKKNLGSSIKRGIRLLVSTTQAPMRLVTSLSLLGASANLLYSIYVVTIAFFKTDVAPGWVSISLQQSGMFFLISLVLLMLGEYILHMTSLNHEGPAYHIGQELTSARMTRKEKLNIEDISLSSKHDTESSDQAVS